MTQLYLGDLGYPVLLRYHRYHHYLLHQMLQLHLDVLGYPVRLCRHYSPLHQLHLAGYVHNDVKPGNLLLGRGATASALHLIDFGLATLAADMCPDSAWRRDMLKGTPSFASLAAHYSRRPMRPVDDIESLVYTLAYLAVGGLPWEGLPEAEVAQLKKRAMTEGCHVFTDPIHSPTVATALRTI